MSHRRDNFSAKLLSSYNTACQRIVTRYILFNRIGPLEQRPDMIITVT